MKNTKNQGLVEWQEKRKRGEVEITRMDPVEKARSNPKSLRAAINGKCFDCCCGSKADVTECEIKDCTLWPVRPWQRSTEND